MKFIPESTIESVAAIVGENEERYQDSVNQFSEEYPMVLAYLLSETLPWIPLL